MTKNENKTQPTDAKVVDFLNSVENEKRKSDAFIVLELMKEVTGSTPKMWGDSMVGFDQYHYKYDSGREGDFFITGFSPRKANLVIYIMPGYGMFDIIMSKLGKFKTGKSCLYINKLEDVDMDVLEELISKSVVHMREKYH